LKVPLHEYPVKEFLLEHKKIPLPKVFVLEAKPKFPVKRMSISLFRLDLFELKERSGISSVDALGIFVTEGKGLEWLGITKLDSAKGTHLECVIFDAGNVRIICNDEDYAKAFFDMIVSNKIFPEWEISTEWTDESIDVSTFMGGLLGISDRINPLDKASGEVKDSLKEATGSYQAQNWKATVVMSRRTIEAVLKDAYRKFFQKDPIDTKKRPLKLYNLISEFEHSGFIPKHWLKIVDAIRLIGNVPGAHPVPIPNYKFTPDDALLALSNTTAFLKAYYNQII